MTGKGQSLFVHVGDLSADKHTSKLLAKLKEMAPDLRVWGIGGPEMVAGGFEALHNCEEFSIVGVANVLPLLRFFHKLRKELVARINNEKPDAILLVDSGGFNLGMAKMLRKSGNTTPIIYFISPQVWGSRPWRINVIAETISKMLVIFPFEEGIYRRRGIEARFVGHPLTKNIPSKEQLQSKEDFCQELGLDPQRPIVAIFPGSRKQEITDHVPVVLESIEWLLEERSDLQFIISKANNRIAGMMEKLVERSSVMLKHANSIKLVTAASTYNVMQNADIVWAKSGTTTLETTLFGKPMLIFYRADWVSYVLAMLYKSVRRFGWPNLLAGEDLVPELIQLDCSARQLVRYTRDLIETPALYEEISKRLSSLRDQLGHGDYATTCAEEILKTLETAQKQVKPNPANV